ECAHSKSDRDHAYSIGTIMGRIDKQNANLLPLFLNEANWRRAPDVAAIECRLHRRPTPLLRDEVEPDNVLVAFEGLYISYRKIMRPLTCAPPLPGWIHLADLKSRKIGPLAGLEACPLR